MFARSVRGVTANAPLDCIPVSLRAGAIVPGDGLPDDGTSIRYPGTALTVRRQT